MTEDKPKRKGTPRPNNGGKREGAGRKPPPFPKKTRNYYLTDTEHTLVQAYIATLRKDKEQ